MADRVSYGPFTLYESEAYKKQKELEQRAREMQVRKLEQELNPQAQIEQQTKLAEAAAAQGFNPEATPAAQAVGQRIYGQAVGMQKIPGTTMEVPVGTPPSMIGSLLKNSASNIKELRMMAEMSQDPYDKKFYSNLADSAEKGLNAKAKELSAADLSFEQNAISAMRYADQFENLINKYGTFELYSPQGSALLKQIPQQMAISYAKLVDPSSVAREGEVEMIKQTIVPLGLFTRNETAKQAIQNFRDDVKNRIENYSRITGRNIEIYGKGQQQQDGQQQVQAGGQQQTQPSGAIPLVRDPATGKFVPAR